jgi:hypothetical protein
VITESIAPVDARPGIEGRAGALSLAALVVAAAFMAGLTTAWLGPSEDATLFVRAGRRLFSGDGLSVFDEPVIQTGPAHLAVNGLAARAGFLGLTAEVRAAVFLGAVVALLILALPMPRAARLGLLGACVLTGPFSVAALDGHFDELLVAATLLLAAAAASRGQAARSGLLIGLAAAWKLSGALGLPLVLLLTGWRARSRASGLAVLTASSCYAPFLIWGVVRTFEFEWRAGEPSPLALVMSNTAPYGWGVRVAQGALVVLVGALFASRARRDGDGTRWAVVPLALVSMRLLADPDILEYYWTGLAMLGLCVVWSDQVRPPEWRLSASLVIFALLGAALTLRGRVGSVGELVLLVGILVFSAGIAGSRRTE